MLLCFGIQAQIYAFEPVPETFSILKQRRLPGVRLLNYGFSVISGQQTIWVVPGNSGLASLYERKMGHLNIKPSREMTVQMETLDEFCKYESIPRIHMLKMDIEGHEFAALKGAKELLRRQAIDCIQFEFGGCNIDSRIFFQDFYYLLFPAYNIYRILPGGLFPIIKYKEIDELFITTNYLAIRREFDI